MRQLIGSSVTYRIALGPQAGRKARVLRTITPLAGEDPSSVRVARANGFSMHAGVSCEAHQREVRERLCHRAACGDDVGATAEAGMHAAHPCAAPLRGDPTVVANRLSCQFVSIDVETCVRCGKAVRVIACIEEPVLIERVLAHVSGKAQTSTATLGPPSTGPPVRA